MKDKQIATQLSLLSALFCFSLPLVSPWFLCLVILSSLPLYFENGLRQLHYYIRILSVFIIIIGVLNSSIDASLGVVFISILSINNAHRYFPLFIAALFLQSSVVATLEGLISELNNLFSITAPALITAFILLILYPLIWRQIVLTLVVVFLVLKLLLFYSVNPFVICAVPAFIMSVSVLFSGALLREFTNLNNKVLFIGAILFVIHWHENYPRNYQNIYLYSPDNVNSTEYQYFKNYKSALRFSGITANDNLSEIKDNSLVLVPWTTEKLNFEFLKSSKNQGKSITVLYVTEHTNMGDTLTNLQLLSNLTLINDDLTVPARNTDISDVLRSSDLNAWDPLTIFNRGASVVVKSITDKVLLSGDAWWVEPNINEWLWVGDYRWTGVERIGRIKLATSSFSDGLNLIIVGDNTPFINSQIISNPKGMLRFLNLATLWPSLIKDGLILFGICLMAFSYKKTFDYKFYYLLLLLIFSHLFARYIISYSPTEKWSNFYINETGFDEANFNKTIAENESIVTSQYLLHRIDAYDYIDLDKLTDSPEVIFGFVSSHTFLPNIKLSDCKRMGSLKLDTGIQLLNAQACHVVGDNVEVLIGDNESAAAFKFLYKGNPKIIILDKNFLSQNAPKRNSEWLIEQFNKSPIEKNR
jgi:hypothetical protein